MSNYYILSSYWSMTDSIGGSVEKLPVIYVSFFLPITY